MSLQIVVGNDSASVADSVDKPFKAIDAGILQYLKQVHTELYEKLKAAVHSITKGN